jgi:Protein of unknown function (DUF3027)
VAASSTVTNEVPAAPAAGKPDAAGVAAVDLARAAAVEMIGADLVGEHLGAEAEEERVVTHLFESLVPGYVGWRWAVTLARVPRGRVLTVDEVVHVPGPEALIAPPWVPWVDRLEPGDVGVGDVLPTADDDPRLEPGWSSVGQDDVDPEVEFVARDLGLARRRVLSAEGRDEAADRWLNGPGGPYVPLAEQAPATCDSCGFLVHIGGALGQAFGICANLYSPSDGHAVGFDHGCGGHSEGSSATRKSRLPQGLPAHVIDELGYDEFGHS